MNRRSIFPFPVVHNQFQAHSLKIDLHQACYLLINITSYNTYSPAQAEPLLMYNEMEPGLVGILQLEIPALLSNILDLPCSDKMGRAAGSPQNWLLWGQLAQKTERKLVKQLDFVFLLHRLE